MVDPVTPVGFLLGLAALGLLCFLLGCFLDMLWPRDWWKGDE